MKHLSRDEMKIVIGGNPILIGCYFLCTVNWPGGGNWNVWMPTNSCEGASCYGGSASRCYCTYGNGNS